MFRIRGSANFAIVVFTGLLLAMAEAQAAQTGEVTITGAVPVACDIVVDTAPTATGIADISQGDTDRAVATVTENCNAPDGYTVSVEGTNSGTYTGLFVDSVSADEHPFTISYDGVAVPANGIVTDAGAPGIDLEKAVTITYGSDAGLTATTGFTYAETLTFTIGAK